MYLIIQNQYTHILSLYYLINSMLLLKQNITQGQLNIKTTQYFQDLYLSMFLVASTIFTYLHTNMQYMKKNMQIWVCNIISFVLLPVILTFQLMRIQICAFLKSERFCFLFEFINQIIAIFMRLQRFSFGRYQNKRNKQIINYNSQEIQLINESDDSANRLVTDFRLILIILLITFSFFYLKSGELIEGLLVNPVGTTNQSIQFYQNSQIKTFSDNYEKDKRIINNFDKISEEFAQGYINKQILTTLKASKYYDIHYFTQDSHKDQRPRIIKFPKQSKHEEQRSYIQFTRSDSQLQLITNQLMYPSYRPVKLPNWTIFENKTQSQIDLAYFNYQLSQNPESQDHLEAEYYRFNKIYKISDFHQQLPLCVVLVGKNAQKTIINTYQSIRRQNYTNYQVVHVDDSSIDKTVQNTIDYLNKNAGFRKKVTIVVQSYQRNNLYNRDYANTQYCKNDEIIIELNPADALIGSQVFQLVNTLYQKGNLYKGKRSQLWALYAANIGYIENCCPDMSETGQVPLQILERNIYRESNYNRSTSLRTYLKKMYNKIDKNEFIDELSLKKNQFYVQSTVQFMHYGMIQISGPEHVKFLDQFLYYKGSKDYTKDNSIQHQYTQLIVKSIPTYYPIENLKQTPKRKISVQIDAEKQLKKNIIYQQLKIKLSDLDQKIKEIYEKQKKRLQTIESRKIFKRQNEGYILGEAKQFWTYVQPSQFSNIRPGFNYSEYGIEDAIQVGSQFDYMGLSRIINFTNLKKQIIDSVAHQVLTFNFDQSVETKGNKLQFLQFKNQSQMQQFLDNAVVKAPGGISIKGDAQFYIGSKLAIQEVDQKSKQLEYYYANKKYKIGQNNEQNSFCIYSSGYNIYSKFKFQKFFQSVQRLNYTNFHVVYVDDYSPDETAYDIYQYVQKKNYRIKNRIKIVRNLQHLGIIANIHVFVLKYCNPKDIVIILDADDNLIGIQTLQILNAVYNNPNNWFVYSRFLMVSEHMGEFYINPSSNTMSIPLKEYRTIQGYWVTSHLRTFRRMALDAVPIQHFIQFAYNKTGGYVYPRYHRSAADRYQVYSNLQVCGQDKIHFISDFFYLYSTDRLTDCHRAHQMFQQFKCRIKIPLQPVDQLDGTVAGYYEDYVTPNKTIQGLKKYYPNYKQCMKQNHLS